MIFYIDVIKSFVIERTRAWSIKSQVNSKYWRFIVDWYKLNNEVFDHGIVNVAWNVAHDDAIVILQLIWCTGKDFKNLDNTGRNIHGTKYVM